MWIKNVKIKVIKGDIADLNVDAIVHDANTGLKMQQGLARDIKQKGGDTIEEEALSKAPIKSGESVITKAGNLKAQHIVHAVTMEMYASADQDAIRKAAASALRCAKKLKVKSIAFPALGYDAGNFPLVGSAKIIIQEILKHVKESEVFLEEVIFCLHDDEAFRIFDEIVPGYIRHMQEDLGPGPYVTVDIIIECEEGIVLIERSNPPYGWALPGGFLDYGESLEQAAIREAKEETNLDLAKMRQFHTYSDPGRDPRFQTISTVFIAEGRGTPQSGDDAKDLKIARYEDLPELEYAFDHKQIIKEYLAEKDLDLEKH